MELQLNKQSVREMTERLRTALGLQSVSHSLAGEALAQALGYRNMDTLSGMMKKEAAASRPASAKKKPSVAVPVLDKPFTLFVEAFACDEYGSAPDWARLTIDQEFLQALAESQQLCVDKSLDHLARDYGWATWADERDGHSYRIQGVELMVGTRSFWLQGRPKHCYYNVETRSIEIAEFFKAVGPDCPRDPYLAWADGILFNDGSCAQDFARGLLDDEVIDINETCIDQMPSGG